MSTNASSVRHRIYSAVDVARHASPSSFWVTFNGNVYDVTPFLEDHPGGDEIMHAYAGKDVAAIMSDEEEHVHSDSAYDMMSEYKIGELGGMEKTVSEDWVAENFHPEDTDILADMKKNKFLDLDRPLFLQVWRANFSKEFYLEQVHQPRHVKGSARLFGPDILEMFTKTKWYIVPMIWGPITMFLAALSVLQFTDK